MSLLIQPLNGDIKIVSSGDYLLQIITIYLGLQILMENRVGYFRLWFAR